MKNNLGLIAIKYAENEKICSTALIGMLNIYKKTYNNFLKLNYDKIEKFLEKIKDIKKEDLPFNELNLTKILYFLSSWDSLIVIKKKGNSLNKKEFDSYIKLNLEEEKEWEKCLNYAEKELKWTGIIELNNRLQFIISFNNNIRIRIDYFQKVLLEIKKEEEKKVKDYRDNNIYNTLFEIFKPKINQYNYLQKTGN